MPDTLGLPQEIWDMILEFVGPKSKDLANPEDRYSLSEESFAPGLPPTEQSPGRADLINFVRFLRFQRPSRSDKIGRETAVPALLNCHEDIYMLALKYDLRLPKLSKS